MTRGSWTPWLVRFTGAITTSWLCLSMSAGADTRFGVGMWPNGRIPYRFADAFDADPWGLPAVALDVGETIVRKQMDVWEAALSVRDPRDPAQVTPHIRFEACAGRCENEANYVLIRQNSSATNDAGTRRETNNLCAWRDDQRREFLGRGPTGVVTHLHLRTGQDENTIRHELGHCLGLWHEFNRDDADGWLEEAPGVDGVAFAHVFTTRPATLMPIVGNYDYDSIMHYEQIELEDGSTVTFTDTNPDDRALEQAFSRWRLDEGIPPLANGVSLRDRSRVLQYYARERHPTWGFFETLSTRKIPPGTSSDILPDPFLAPDVRALGTPAVAHRGDGAYDVFVRGSDQQMYWKAVARAPLGLQLDVVDAPGPWVPLGGGFTSDPAAVSRAAGQIDLVAFDRDGQPVHARYANGAWGAWRATREVVTLGGTRPGPNGSVLGAALASRTAGTLDLVVVKRNGVMAVSTLANGIWGAWRDLGAGYTVTARPAAVALSTTTIQLAIVVSNTRLHEVAVVMAAPPTPLGFALGAQTATVAHDAAPALASVVSGRYRVLIVTQTGRIAHKYSWTGWRDVGGIPLRGTGVAAVGLGWYAAEVVMNGEDAVGCARTCVGGDTIPAHFIQPGGLWVRKLMQ